MLSTVKFFTLCRCRDHLPTLTKAHQAQKVRVLRIGSSEISPNLHLLSLTRCKRDA